MGDSAGPAISLAAGQSCASSWKLEDAFKNLEQLTVLAEATSFWDSVHGILVERKMGNTTILLVGFGGRRFWHSCLVTAVLRVKRFVRETAPWKRCNMQFAYMIGGWGGG